MRTYLMVLSVCLSTTAFGQPAQVGQWSQFLPLGPSAAEAVVAEHMLYLPTGNILILAEQAYTCGSPGISRAIVYLWTPPAIGAPPNDPGEFVSIPVPECRTWITCTGHSALENGRILFAGEADYNAGVPHANLFDPFLGQPWNNPFTPPDMTDDRWYPSCVTFKKHHNHFNGQRRR